MTESRQEYALVGQVGRPHGVNGFFLFGIILTIQAAIGTI